MKPSKEQYRPTLDAEDAQHDKWVSSLTDEQMTKLAKAAKRLMEKKRSSTKVSGRGVGVSTFFRSCSTPEEPKDSQKS